MQPGKRLVRYTHYLDELSRKPQAVRQVSSELLEELGPRYRKLWRMLDAAYGEKETSRLFARLLGVVVTENREAVADALEQSLQAGRFDLLRLQREAMQQDVLHVEVPESLAQYEVESAKAEDFDVLLEGTAS